jgi:hypothetical protein
MDTNETTSKDMVQPVTREEHKKDLEDLKNELLAKLVTKEEHQKGIANLVTKKEHKKDNEKIYKQLDHITTQVARNSADIIEIKQKLAGLPEKIDQILKIVDGLMKIKTDEQIEKVAQEATFRRHEKIISDHEVRLGQLEKKCA